jgi:hypothetical protein
VRKSQLPRQPRHPNRSPGSRKSQMGRLRDKIMIDPRCRTLYSLPYVLTEAGEYKDVFAPQCIAGHAMRHVQPQVLVSS